MANLSRRAAARLAIGASVVFAGRSVGQSGIDESGFNRIGGINQWVAVQGTDRSNPVILFLHGGPGEAQSPFLREFFPWEKDFTVVNWDQRGSGKTFGQNGSSTPNATFDQLIDDTCALADQIRTRLSKKKIILVGQSVGSFLGAHVVKKRPDLFHAFVGTGQLVSFQATVATQVPWARQQAQTAGDQAGLKALDEATAKPFPQNVMAQAAASRKWLWPSSDVPYTDMIHEFENSGSKEAADWHAGVEFSGQHYARSILPGDLHMLGSDIPLPFFVVQGREDHIVGVEPAESYVREIQAPAKAFVLIDGGHYACFTNPGQFLGALNKHVRPLAI